MTTRRQPVSNAHIARILDLAGQHGFRVSECVLEVGPDYVRITPPGAGESELAKYIGSAHRPQKAANR
jgi:hypothetical protein